uniref:Uncharacterized protein n=1 Tax=Triticum urartu TaxID=4572 RepID=A0A8R7QYK8_TRIUA
MSKKKTVAQMQLPSQPIKPHPLLPVAIQHLPKATGEQAEQNPWRQFFFHSNLTHPLRRCTTLRRGRRCPTRTMCRSATRRRAASTHACSRRCAAFAATRRASAASTASAAAVTKPAMVTMDGWTEKGAARDRSASTTVNYPPKKLQFRNKLASSLAR